jgi:hypothetical protein
MDIENEKYSSAIEHIDTIIADIDDHIKKKKDFTAFVLLALGIEFLGNFFDNNPFDMGGQSEIRYGHALKNLFPDWYKNNQTFMYKEFRGPLVHQYRTGDNIYLTSVCKNTAKLEDHRTTRDNKRIFVVEQLFNDFKSAADKLKNIAKKPNYQAKDKSTSSYAGITILTIKDDENSSNRFLPVSGTPYTYKTDDDKKK